MTEIDKSIAKGVAKRELADLTRTVDKTLTIPIRKVTGLKGSIKGRERELQKIFRNHRDLMIGKPRTNKDRTETAFGEVSQWAVGDQRPLVTNVYFPMTQPLIDLLGFGESFGGVTVTLHALTRIAQRRDGLDTDWRRLPEVLPMGWMSLWNSTDHLWFPTRDGGLMLFDGRTAVTYISDAAMTKPKLKFRDAMVAKLGKEPSWPFLIATDLDRRTEAAERMGAALQAIEQLPITY